MLWAAENTVNIALVWALGKMRWPRKGPGLEEDESGVFSSADLGYSVEMILLAAKCALCLTKPQRDPKSRVWSCTPALQC